MSRPATKQVSTDCPLHETGPVGSAAAVLRRHGDSMKSFHEHHADLHAQRDRALRAPGGASVLVAEAARMRGNLADLTDRLADARSPRQTAELKSQIENVKRDLAARESLLATLPAEALEEPAFAVQRAAARGGGDPEKVREAAREVGRLRAWAAGVQAERLRLAAATRQTVEAAHGAVLLALTAALKAKRQEVAAICDKPEIADAPELLDVPALAAAVKAAQNLAQLGEVIGAPVNLDSILDAIPDEVYAQAAPVLRLPERSAWRAMQVRVAM